MPKLISPTGETVSASRAGAKVLIARGYVDPSKPTTKKRGNQAETAPVNAESAEEEQPAESTDEPTKG